MADYHEYVDGIRAILQTGQLPDEATLSDLAEGYGRVCAEANERLTGCVRLLHQGLRTEAIHQAETEPNLLDTLTSLDFPERPEWDELSEDRALHRSPALNLDAARELNEAYSQQDPLRDLLRRHRRMALSQASLAKRLALLRKIASHDPNTPIWREDIQKYEATRLLQIQADADQALAAMDVMTLQGLLTELEDANWSTLPSAALIRRVSEELGQVRRVQGRRALESLSAELRSAYSTQDFEALSHLRDRWDDEAAQAELVDHDPILEHVRPVFTWFEAESSLRAADRAYEGAVAALGAALDRGESDYLTLSELGESVAACGRGTPRELAARLTPRLKELKKRRIRRMLSLSATAVAVLSISLFLVYQSLSERSLLNDSASAAEILNDHLESGNLERAESHWAELPPEIKNSQAVMALQGRLEALRVKTLQDEDRLRRWLSELKNRVPDQPAPPPLADGDGPIPVPERWHIEVEKTTRDYEARYEQEQAATEGRHEAQLRALGGKLTELETLARNSIDSSEIDPAADSIDAELAPLLRSTNEKFKNVISKAEAFKVRLAMIRKQRANWARQIDLEKSLTLASRMTDFDDASFTQVLQEYTKEFPETTEGKDFKRILDEGPVWRGAIAWAKALDQWKKEDLLELDPEASKSRAAQCLQVLASYPGFPDREAVEEYQKHLEAVARRIGLIARQNGKPIGILAEIEGVWRDRFAADLRVMADRDGKRHYYIEDPKIVGQSTSFHCIIANFNNKDKNLKQITLPFNHIVTDGKAPQCLIAAKATRSRFFENRWEAANLDLLHELSDPRKDLDPIFRIYLLRTTAELAAEGSLALEKSLAPLIDAISRENINTKVLWMDPDNEGANQERKRAERALPRLPPISGVLEQVTAFHNTLRAKLLHRRIPVGRLEREGTSWRFGEAIPVRDGTSLLIVIPKEDTSAWQSIGAKQAGETDLNGGSAGAKAWVEGRPVFVDIPADSTKP